MLEEVTSSLEYYLLLGVVLIIGVGLIKDGWDRYNERRKLEDTPTSNIHSLSLGEVEVKGTFLPRKDSHVRRGIFGDVDEVLFQEWKLERKSGDSWKTIYSNEYLPPFYIDDGTGRILVDSKGYQLHHSITVDYSDDQQRTERYNSKSDIPEAVLNFIEERVDEEVDVETFLGANDYRVKQKYIQPQEDGIVYGSAIRRDDHDTQLKIEEKDTTQVEGVGTLLITEGNSSIFFMSNQDEDELIDERSWYLFWRLPVGAVLTAASFVLFIQDVLTLF